MADGLDALRGRLAAAMTARGFAAQAAALDRLGARSEGPDTVLPVLVKNYAPYAVAALAGLVLGWLLGRRRS